MVVEVYVIEDVVKVVGILGGVGEMIIGSVSGGIVVSVVRVVGDDRILYFLDSVDIGENLEIRVVDLGVFGFDGFEEVMGSDKISIGIVVVFRSEFYGCIVRIISFSFFIVGIVGMLCEF